MIFTSAFTSSGASPSELAPDHDSTHASHSRQEPGQRAGPPDHGSTPALHNMVAGAGTMISGVKS